MIYDTCLSRFLPFNDGWAADLEIALIFSTADISPSLSSAFALSLYRFCTCSPLSFPPTIPLHTVSAPPSQWLCGFLHLCYIMALRGRGHFNQYFKQPRPGGLAPNATWQHERMTFGETGGVAPKYLLLPTVGRWLWLGGRKCCREHWWERLGTTGEGKKFQEKQEQQADKNTSTWEPEPRVIHVSQRDKSQSNKQKWNYS